MVALSKGRTDIVSPAYQEKMRERVWFFVHEINTTRRRVFADPWSRSFVRVSLMHNDASLDMGYGPVKLGRAEGMVLTDFLKAATASTPYEVAFGHMSADQIRPDGIMEGKIGNVDLAEANISIWNEEHYEWMLHELGTLESIKRLLVAPPF